MSPRAAWRLEELGFERAYDFVGGKTAWIERGLPTVGTGPNLLLAGQVLRPATTTCRPDTLSGLDLRGDECRRDRVGARPLEGSARGRRRTGGAIHAVRSRDGATPRRA